MKQLTLSLLLACLFALPAHADSAKLTVLPNDNPTVVKNGTDQQFLAQIINDDGTASLPGEVTWSVQGKIGRITSSGVFTAEKKGKGSVQAEMDGQKTKVKVSVNENGAVAGASTDDASCTTLRGWVWLLLLFVYCIAMFVVFVIVGDSKSAWWWLWPLLLTGAFEALFFAIRCPGVQTWIPITIGGLGVLLTALYVRVFRTRGTEPSLPPQPPTPPVTPAA